MNESRIEVPGIYTHNKTGIRYSVMFMAVNCTNGREDEHMVIYVKSKEHSLPYAREVSEFLDKFTLVR